MVTVSESSTPRVFLRKFPSLLSFRNVHMGHGGSSLSAGVSTTAATILFQEEECELRDFLAIQEDDLTLQMPEECLACIFQKLGNDDRKRCSLVCKRWHWVEAKFRDRLTLKAEQSLAPDVPALMLRFEHVTNLSLKCARKQTSIGDTTLVLIGKHCKRLVRLKLRGCKAVTDDGLEQFSKVCGSLKKLSCGSCGFGAQGLNAILHNCSNLGDLSVKRLRRLVDNPDIIGGGKGKLQRLSLKDLFHAQLFGALLAGSKHLHTLILARNPGYWDQLFEIVTEHLPELTELHMESLRLSDRGLNAISCCTKLEVLYVIKATDCSDRGFTAIANGCRSLRKLHIDDRKSSRIGDEGLIAIANKCTQLQELVLIGVNVTTASLSLIGSNCTGLERMALCNSEAIGDGELCCIAEKCVSLKKLCIKNCPISDHGLELFANGCPNLSKMKVKKCKNVTPTSATWLQMNRASLIVSLDSPSVAAEGDEQGMVLQNEDRIIRAPTTMLCNRSPLVNRITLAAGSLWRRFPKLS